MDMYVQLDLFQTETILMHNNLKGDNNNYLKGDFWTFSFNQMDAHINNLNWSNKQIQSTKCINFKHFSVDKGATFEQILAYHKTLRAII